MGAGPEMPYPKWVWTPAGGWYNRNPNWQRNTAIAGGVWLVILAVCFDFGRKHERRLKPPNRPIPSQMWCKHAREDDPNCVF